MSEATVIEGNTQTYKAKTGLDVGRAVKQVIEDIDIQAGIETEPNVRRKLIRHEVSHALGYDQALVNEHSVGGYFKIKDGDQRTIELGIELNTSLKEVGARTNISGIKSLLAPLSDKRVKQSLSR